MGTQVITRDSGRRLGVVGEVVVDIDRREVVALGLRDNPLTRFLPGLPRWMPLDRIRQVGDVILVDSADSLAEGFDPDRFSKVINCQVVSESGVQLGRVLGFSFDIETGELTTLVIGALGVPLLGEGVLSTWELAVTEIVSSGTDRIVVYEGAEEKLRQLGTGLLEKLGIGGSGWEQEERDRFRSTLVPAENQLPAGEATPVVQRRLQASASRSFEPRSELEYVELEERRQQEPLRQRRYLDDDLPDRSDRGDWDRPQRDRQDEPDWSSGRDPRAWDGPDQRREREPAREWREREREDAPSRAERWPDPEAYPEADPTGRGAARPSSARSLDLDDPTSREPRAWSEASGERDRADGRSPGRSWDREPLDGPSTGRSQPARRPEPMGRREPDEDNPVAYADEAPPVRRRPLNLEPSGDRDRFERNAQPPGSAGPRRSNEPIDVEPEILDDPW